ncbi:metallopeptidase family protein [Corynebacterium diphtheriae]|uniref:metallopeptidase family protein n=1 Tax=Corynebacterium diphtheriae TaxID=1717 RepID=UPI0009286440|nr:metallopeptidase family protein [Corynebacterium diphtheriae]OJH96426.1 hypothetical protein BKD78_06690 [Corynebacterium diphtheriae]OSQ01847.1 hypothetical protein B1A65_05520 [Corynebacterium diphtheriae]CAB0590914.1 metallopeptidase family protein [Corynebacterium diphtheriae]CAB0637575.1 metallopeptidase family protein [Corynebacterium diphtheriae]
MTQRLHRDRHDRGVRGPLFSSALPRYRSRRQRFDATVLEAYAPLQQRYATQLTHLDIAVDTVPRMRLGFDPALVPDEVVADGPVPLGRVIPAGVDSSGRPTRARLVLFRMAIEQRVVSAQERRELVTTVLTALVANYLNISPTDIDPNFQW